MSVITQANALTCLQVHAFTHTKDFRSYFKQTFKATLCYTTEK